MMFQRILAGLAVVLLLAFALSAYAQTDPLRDLIDAAGDADKYPDAAAVVVFDG